MFCFGTEIGTENRGFSLVLVPNTEILVPWQPYSEYIKTNLDETKLKDFLARSAKYNIPIVFNTSYVFIRGEVEKSPNNKNSGRIILRILHS